MLFLPVEKLPGRKGDAGLWSQPTSPTPVHFPHVTFFLSLSMLLPKFIICRTQMYYEQANEMDVAEATS